MKRRPEKLPADVQTDLERLLRCIEAKRSDIEVLHRSVAGSGPDAMVDAFAHWVYENWYCSLLEPAPSQPTFRYPVADLSSGFRAALPGSRRWTRRWTVVAAGKSGSCIAGRRGEARELRCGQYAGVFRPGLPVAPGDGVAVMECLDWVDRETGFWATRSRHGEPKPPFLRLYLSPTVDTVCPVLTRITILLDSLRLRYSLKCPFRPGDFVRVDSLVVYLERPALSVIREPLMRWAARSSFLRESTPPLTRRIAHGISVADDAGGTESFGQHRCRSLALELVEAAEGQRMATLTVRDLVNALRRGGIDPRRPWAASHLGQS